MRSFDHGGSHTRSTAPLAVPAEAWPPALPQVPSAPLPAVDRAAPSTAVAAEHEAIHRSSNVFLYARLLRRNIAHALDHPLKPIAPLRADELLEPDAMEKSFDIERQNVLCLLPAQELLQHADQSAHEVRIGIRQKIEPAILALAPKEVNGAHAPMDAIRIDLERYRQRRQLLAKL